MGLKDRRSNLAHGKYSTVLVLPAKLEKGKESTLAANRLIIVDPRGEISEHDLLEFLETFVEPYFWSWYLKKRRDVTVGPAQNCEEAHLNERRKA
jgi:hypothetical protein